MRIALFIDRWEPERGGAERALAALARGALDAGHDVHVFGLRAAADAPGVFHALDVPRLARGKLERELANRSAEAARELGCDVTVGIRHLADVDVYWPHGGLHSATLAAGERSRGGIAKSISHVLHLFSPRHREFLKLEEELLDGGGARWVWCVSERVRQELASLFPACADRLEVHPNGVDVDRFHPGLRDEHREAVRQELGIPPDVPVMLFLGGNWRLKGWHVLVAALRELGKTDCRVIAVGRGSPAAARSAERVIAVPSQDARRLYGAADLMVQPTWRDPCSLATLEALACGLPVVTTDANGAGGAIHHGEAGEVVPAGDVDALAGALRRWLDRAGDGHIRQRAREAAEDRPAGAWTAALLESLERAVG